MNKLTSYNVQMIYLIRRILVVVKAGVVEISKSITTLIVGGGGGGGGYLPIYDVLGTCHIFGSQVLCITQVFGS